MSSDIVATQSQTKPVDTSPTIRRVEDLVGHTPLVRLRTCGGDRSAAVYLKMENLNPSGSLRDRYVAEIVERAVLAGQLVPGDTIALAGLDDSAVAAAFFGSRLGVKTRIFAPRDANRRLMLLVHRYGAQIVWTDAAGGLPEAIEDAADWARKQPDRMYIDSYRREAVRDAYGAMANEILQAINGRILGAFVTSVTTGGTFREVSKALRQTHPSMVVAGAVLTDAKFPGLTGHRYDFLKHLSMEDVWSVRDEVARSEGLLLGPKGAACVAIARELQRNIQPDEVIVALNPDSGQRYLGWETTPLFQATFLPPSS